VTVFHYSRPKWAGCIRPLAKGRTYGWNTGSTKSEPAPLGHVPDCGQSSHMDGRLVANSRMRPRSCEKTGTAGTVRAPVLY